MPSKLLKLIAEGEHQMQDFKFCVSDSRKIAKSLVAFANTDGGRLLLGVKDNGKIAGVSSDEEFYMIEAAANMYAEPKIPFTTYQWNVNGKTVLEINVDASPNKPHFAKDDSGKWIAYIRKRDENIVVNRIQVEVWKKQKSPKGIYISYSDDEKFLVDYLNSHGSITLSKFMRTAPISRNKAIDILSNFILLDILVMEAGKDITYFKLNEDFNQLELKKFQ